MSLSEYLLSEIAAAKHEAPSVKKFKPPLSQPIKKPNQVFLSDKEKIEIIQLRSNGVMLKVIAGWIGCSISTVKRQLYGNIQKRISIGLPPELYQRISAISAQENTTICGTIEKLINHYEEKRP